jgi:hypothetical protein
VTHSLAAPLIAAAILVAAGIVILILMDARDDD